MDINVAYSQTANSQDAFKAACAEITPEYVAKFNVQADIDVDDQQKKIVATGKGFELKISFEETSAKASLNLSFFLKPLKNKILQKVKRKLEKTV